MMDICTPIQIGLSGKKAAYIALRDALRQCEEFIDDIKTLV